MKDRRALVALLLFVALIAATFIFASDSSPFEQSTPDPTATTVPAVLDPANEPDPEQQGLFSDEIDRLIALENQAYSTPDADLVETFMTRGCECFSETFNRISDLQANGWRVRGANIAVENASVYLSTPNSMEGVINVAPLGQPTVDASGQIVEESPSGAFQPLVIVLEKGQNGEWRISDRRLPEEVF